MSPIIAGGLKNKADCCCGCGVYNGESVLLVDRLLALLGVPVVDAVLLLLMLFCFDVIDPDAADEGNFFSMPYFGSINTNGKLIKGLAVDVEEEFVMALLFWLMAVADTMDGDSGGIPPVKR